MVRTMTVICFCIMSGFFLCLGGCSLAPKYLRPAAPVSAQWPKGEAYKARWSGVQPSISWQEFFINPKLRKVVAMALENNRDLRVAALNIEKAIALYQIQRSELFPGIDASGSWSKEHQLISGLPGGAQSPTIKRYSVELGISAWELDIFGRIRSLKEQALEQFSATEQAQRGVQISLVAEVANTWLALAADQEQLKLAQDTLKNRQDAYQLVRRRFELGVSSELDLRQAQMQVEAAKVDVARYTTLVAQDENALNLAVGKSVPPELLPHDLSETLAAVKEVAPGLPSDVLLRRPDILQAEDILKGANANIGAARADFFPRITLTTNIGLMSEELSRLFKSGSDTWGFVPQVILPIFDAGASSANLRAAKVDRDIALARYEKAIQTAFREVADALAQRGTIDEQAAAQRSLTDAAAATYHLSMSCYEKGIDSYLNVLDAQRSLYAAQQGLIAIRLARLTNLVTLYKVLGGGGPQNSTSSNVSHPDKQ
ncbi:efflux transporter outer membrane subunit [Dissulfurimicrobium hydrothermale]|uniref:efflux transporter outer membrane subunit n=1 Tax=Dissulfurimicrobium hydrothermale TaxID=1750598 RepID=UPI001EDC0E9B|nr:efflux transporter outer membrane subunit [Dissulfurimicrobium hydrothermale]UKL14533.1 efflux transporter outer membrane subunit [Dissulfurimicrobium hydrothermale]